MSEGIEVIHEPPPVIEISQSGPPGPQGEIGPQGDPGPPGGARVTGWWTYNATTSPPPAAGQARTSTDVTAVGGTTTMWISHTDADGLVWAALPVVGDSLLCRDETGNRWSAEITSVSDVSGPTGYVTLGLTVTETTGTAKKNTRTQVNFIHPDASVLTPVSAFPSSPSLGQMVLLTSDSKPYYYNGTSWVSLI